MNTTDPLPLALRAAQSGQFDQAARLCELALSEQPGRIDALKILSGVRFMEGRLDEALATLERAATASPNDPQIQANLGSILTRLARPDEAIASYRRAIALAPGYAEAHYNLGATLTELERHEDALACYRRVLDLAPGHPKALINCGGALSALGRNDEALAFYDQAIASDPGNVEAETNRGTALHRLGRSDEAMHHYEEALRLRPEDAVARWNRGLIELYKGDFARGWVDYELRWQKPDFAPYRRNFVQPVWRGETDIAGKTILIYSEQGFGDTLQFCRYATLLAERGARVIVQVQPPLEPLLRSLAGATAVITTDEPLPAFDVHCPIMSLPLAFHTDLATIPGRVPYLSPSPEALARWRDRLGPRAKPRIGIAWTGNPALKSDRIRSMTLARLAPLVSDSRFEWHVLQKDIRDADRDTLGQLPQLRAHSDELIDFDHTAALTTQMDLVLSVCTSIIHLAGSLAKPGWVMLPVPPDWRWLERREDSPWYPTLRLFRSQTVNGWDDVVGR
ncbi:MAG TPA: tetratricopeptide repeat protein, partial [Alphaproteobacteria bacterium]|nr:tetratricopeptide repeat protein [Alphaproteobacteria bacterium]